MTKFSDIPWFALEEYLNLITEEPAEYPDYEGYSNEGGAYLFRANHAIITQNTDPMKFYAKNEDSDYRPLNINIMGAWNPDYNIIRFRKLPTKLVVPSNDIKRVVNEYGYERTTFNAITDDSPLQYDIEPNDLIYSRKDSLLHDWMWDNKERFEDFVNLNSPFQLIGTGYSVSGGYIDIYYWSMKDWFKEAIPKNNRFPKFDEFIDLLFDKIYHQIYNKQKNSFNLIDPLECHYPYIDLLYEFYRETLFSEEISEFDQRLFLENIIYYLKKKGTYSSVYMIWKLLSYKTGNSLTIYDRWHDYLEAGQNPMDHFEDIDATEKTPYPPVEPDLSKYENVDVVTMGNIGTGDTFTSLMAEVIDRGDFGNDEMSIVFDYRKWYTGVWQRSSSLIVNETGNVEIYIDNLDVDSSYEYRVIVLDSELPGIELAGNVLSFHTMGSNIVVPELTVFGYPDHIHGQSTMYTTDFDLITGNDTHISTDWKITRTSDNVIVWESLDNTEEKTEKMIDAGHLETSTEYIFAARHRGEIYGYSNWAEVIATTAATFIFIQPPILSVQGAPDSVPERPNISGGEFTVVGSEDTHIETEWEIVKTSDDTVVYYTSETI